MTSYILLLYFPILIITHNLTQRLHENLLGEIFAAQNMLYLKK